MRRIEVPELAPGVCFLCEQAHQDGLQWLDTGREFITGVVTHLTGRKVVCSRCIVALGEQIGLRPTDAVEAAELRAADAEARLIALRAHVREVAASLEVESLVLAEGAAEVPAEVVEAAAAAAEQLPLLPAEEKPRRKRRPVDEAPEPIDPPLPPQDPIPVDPEGV